VDPIFPLAILSAIAGVAALTWRSVRAPNRRPHGRTSWSLLLGFCPRRVYACPMADDIRAGRDACTKCRNRLDDMDPLSRYQIEGRGTGLKLDPAGPLVASLCHGDWEASEDEERRPHGEWHAPLFDLDYPATLAYGTTTHVLVLKKPVSVAAHRAVRTLLVEARLAAAPHDDAPASDARCSGIAGYRVAAADHLPEAVFHLTCPARLVPSGTAGHFHLYLETEVRWTIYLRLMRAMADAGLLESAWVEMSARRSMAMLRKPEFKKKAPH